jgi:hypothetical protein
MNKMVDSKKDKLSIPEIITRAVYSNPPKGVPPYAAILSIVKEGTLPNTEVKQYGNTVFITHFGKDRDLAVGQIGLIQIRHGCGLGTHLCLI